MIVMQSIKNVSRNGRTVMVTIHQPSIDIFETFDALILLRRGGTVSARLSSQTAHCSRVRSGNDCVGASQQSEPDCSESGDCACLAQIRRRLCAHCKCDIVYHLQLQAWSCDRRLPHLGRSC